MLKDRAVKGNGCGEDHDQAKAKGYVKGNGKVNGNKAFVKVVGTSTVTASNFATAYAGWLRKAAHA